MSTWMLEVLEPFTVRRDGQVTTWKTGDLITLSPEQAQRVLDAVGSKVRILTNDRNDLNDCDAFSGSLLTRGDREKLLENAPNRYQSLRPVIEPAHPYARLIYFEDGFGHILGPIIPEFLARDGDTFWIVATWECETRWIRSDRLRSEPKRE